MILRNVPGFKQLYEWVGAQADTTLTVLLALAGIVLLYAAFNLRTGQKAGILSWIALP